MAIKTDFLVIGSGIGGLSYALKVSEVGEVVVVTKKEDSESNTNYAQGGIASVVSSDDTFEAHIQDTLGAGDGLCKPEVVEKVIKSGPKYIKELLSVGVNFTRDRRGEFDLGREGGHTRKRVLHVQDFTGREIENALLRAVKSKGNIRLYENHIAVDLITEKSSKKDIKCLGAFILDIDENKIDTFLSRIILLATGGAGRAYRHTTNPRIATGDGVAMAYRAGAKISNMEFIQFHPTSLYHPQGESFLISEAVRGEGGKLKLRNGKAFMHNYHPLKELAARDVVARAIDSELKKSGDACVFLDITHLNSDFIRTRFPNIYNKCLTLGIDITREWIPVVPAAHYMCGGILTHLNGTTNIKNLFACGEVSMTGMHGANRLASNSLLEAIAFADFAAKSSKSEFKKEKGKRYSGVKNWETKGRFHKKEWVIISHDKKEIQNLMWDYVGIVRSDRRLKRAASRVKIILKEIEEFFGLNPVKEEVVELRNIATIAELIILSAISRKESRGLHYNVDHPERDDKGWKRDTIVQKEDC
ncbi:MAG: L-aspartate oxidase [candidate division Zixibacteria bacterium SM23_73_2]|nr:MAG: L-aspartate oxidase [candidate division Zixibacteria bacterium SM23_73_2]